MADPVPDIYCDQAQIVASPFDVILELGRRRPEIGSMEPAERVGSIRMSLEHAKVLAIMLTKALHDYEESIGATIPVHPQVRESLGFSQTEDW